MSTTTKRGWRTDLDCDTAEEFLAVLNPISGLFQQQPTSGFFVFRGVSSSTYLPIPSAFRPTSSVLFAGAYTNPPLRHAIDQCVAELHTLRRFFDIASRHGVRLPEDSQSLRHRLDDWEWRLRYRSDSDFEPFTWPPVEFYSIIALAQHYGIATRALDWSWSALTAGYFAARSANLMVRDRICVWVINSQVREFHAMLSGAPMPSGPIVLFTASGADNENLRAQQGLFTLHSQIVAAYDEKFVVRPYDELFVETFPAPTGASVVHRISAPSAEANHVLRRLAGAGVTAGTLFPGLWGVAREFEEQRLWVT